MNTRMNRVRGASHTLDSLTMVTFPGLLRNTHSGIVQSEVILDDLFRA